MDTAATTKKMSKSALTELETSLRNNVSLEVMTSQELLSQHMTKDLVGPKSVQVNKNDKKFDCQVVGCSKTFAKPSLLKVHLKTHSDSTHKCTYCHKLFKTVKQLGSHVYKIHDKDKHKAICRFCGRKFAYKCKLDSHERVHTGEKPYKCETCGKCFSSQYSLKTHLLIHQGEKPYKCKFCDYACRDSSTIRKHQERHQGIKIVFPCDQCTKTFSSRFYQESHILEVHNGLKLIKFKCKYCKKAYKTKYARKNHVKIEHSGFAPNFECDICGKKFKLKNNLKTHLSTHSDEKKYQCSYPKCGAKYKAMGDLKKHEMKHDPTQHLDCEICGRTFYRSSCLKKHLIVMHRDRYKKVPCNICKVKFYSSNYLLKHIEQIHSPNKKYLQCDICDVKTNTKPSMINHLKKHDNENDRTCKICKTQYKDFKYLKRHYLMTHNFRYKPGWKITKSKSKQYVKTEKCRIIAEYGDKLKMESHWDANFDKVSNSARIRYKKRVDGKINEKYRKFIDKDLRIVLKRVELEYPYCLECNKVFNTYDELVLHAQEHVKEEIIYVDTNEYISNNCDTKNEVNHQENTNNNKIDETINKNDCDDKNEVYDKEKPKTNNKNDVADSDDDNNDCNETVRENFLAIIQNNININVCNVNDSSDISENIVSRNNKYKVKRNKVKTKSDKIDDLKRFFDSNVSGADFESFLEAFQKKMPDKKKMKKFN